MLTIGECHDGKVPSGHLELLEALSGVRVGGERLIILICQSLRVTDFAIGVIFNPWFFVLVEVIRFLLVILGGVLAPRFFTFIVPVVPAVITIIFWGVVIGGVRLL